MSNVTEVPNVERDKLIAAVEQLKRTMPVMLEYSALNAKLKFAQYTDYVNAGFTPQQALELCR